MFTCASRLRRPAAHRSLPSVAAFGFARAILARVWSSSLPRRQVLRLAAAGAVGAVLAPALAGCDDKKAPTPSVGGSGGGPGDAADVAAVAAAVASHETGLIDAYDAAIAMHPSLASRLRPLREDHEAHRSALVPAQTASASATGASSGTPPVPAEPAAALAWLASLENKAADARLSDLVGMPFGGDAPGLARLLASIGGCEAAHAALLDASGTSSAGAGK